MYISCNIIKSFLRNNKAIDWANVWNKFTIVTAEVESVVKKGLDLNRLVVGKVLAITPLSEKNDYSLIKIDVGSAIQQSVSNFQNLTEGMLVPVSLEGGSVVSISKIAKQTIEGEYSECLICSEKELGLGDNSAGAVELAGNLEAGIDLKKILPLEDTIVEIDNKSLTNRPDLWGHYGIAREIAAITGMELKELESEFPICGSEATNLEAVIKDKINCNRFSGIRIANLSNKATPIDIKILLHYCGMRSRSLVVDLTNFIMLELGQPLHAYDGKVIDKIIVDNTQENSYALKTLDNVKRKIPRNTVIINNSRRILGIAGVMGGQSSEVRDTTTEIVVESANFAASTVRITASKMGLRTDASARFEKSLDPNLTIVALNRFFKTLKRVDNQVRIASNIVDLYINEVNPININLPKKQLTKYLGEELSDSLVVRLLTSLCFEVTNCEDHYQVMVPTFRATKDISSAVDIIEEIARVYGYNNLSPEPIIGHLLLPQQIISTKEIEYNAKNILASRYNLNEVHSYIWYDTKFIEYLEIAKDSALKIANTSKNENNLLRQELALSLLHCVHKNAKKRDKIGIFEIGSVVTKNQNGHEECKRLGIALLDSVNNTQALYLKMKDILYTTLKMIFKCVIEFEKTEREANGWEYGQSVLSIVHNDKPVGYLAIVNSYTTAKIASKSVCVVAELFLSELDYFPVYHFEYREPSKYPSVDLDYNFVVPSSSTYHTIKQYFEDYQSELIQKYELIDYYEGSKIEVNKKSLTFRFTIGSHDRTLTNTDIARFSKSLLDYMASKEIYIRE